MSLSIVTTHRATYVRILIVTETDSSPARDIVISFTPRPTEKYADKS